MQEFKQPEEQQDNAFDLRDLFIFLWQKKIRIVLTTLIMVIVGFAYITKLPKFYRATSTVLLAGQGQSQSLPFSISSFSNHEDVQIETYVEFIKSRNFILTVVDDLKLTDYPEFRSNAPGADEERHIDYAVSEVLHNLSLNRIGETYMLRISYESSSPRFAAEIANHVGPAFFKFQNDINQQKVTSTSVWLNTQLSELKTKLSESEQQLKDFLEKYQLIDAKSQLELMGQEISALMAEKLANEKTLSTLKDTVNQISRPEFEDVSADDIATLPWFLNNPLLNEVRKSINQQKLVLLEISKRYKEKHHKHIAAKAGLDALLAEQDELIRKLVGSVKYHFSTLSVRNKDLNQQLTKARERHAELGQHGIELNKLKRDVETTQQLYNVFLDRLREAEFLKDMDENEDFAVVDTASEPVSPSKPRVTLLLAILGLFALFVSIGLWLTLHLISDRKTRYRFLLQKQGIAILGEFPKASKLKKLSAKNLREIKKAPNKAQILYAEAVRALRSELLLRFDSAPLRIVAITSVQHGKQRSKLSIELAESFGHLEKTILVDADLRSPQIGAEYGFEKLTPGLTNFISRRSSFSDASYTEKSRQLTVMPSGPVPSDPLVYFTKPRFGSFIKKLGVLFDRVIVDTPPVNAFSDALVISKSVDAVILLCDLEVTESVDLMEAIERLQESRVPLLGVVFENTKNVKSKFPKRSRSKAIIKKLVRF